MGGGTLLRKSPFDTWPQWRAKVAQGEQMTPWHSCSRCGGQRVEFAADLRHYRPCVDCLGIGEVPAA